MGPKALSRNLRVIGMLNTYEFFPQVLLRTGTKGRVSYKVQPFCILKNSAAYVIF